MHPLVYLLMISGGTCFAHYRGGYESRNLIERDEPVNDDEGEIVECPVCEDAGHWMSSNEECPIVKGMKKFKKCELGTYINKVCGYRKDCYRGPGEQCTEKRVFDIYGQKCAPGYYCNEPMGICQGLGYAVDSNVQYLLNPHHRYSLQPGAIKNRAENSKFGFDSIRN